MLRPGDLGEGLAGIIGGMLRRGLDGGATGGRLTGSLERFIMLHG